MSSNETKRLPLPKSRAASISGPILATLLIWAAFVGLSCWRYQPLDVVPADAAANVFSAERAEIFFERLYRDANPHPAGDNQQFREKIVSEFEAMGYQVQQKRYLSDVKSKRTKAKQVEVVNLSASPPPSEWLNTGPSISDGPSLLLVAHYDSHPAGPGASDDGIAVAAMLEIARMLKGGAPRVHFLLTDGEEFGLLGAKKFVQNSRLVDSQTIVINLEARGTNGPSLMFETSENSSWLVNEYANAVRRPATSSLFYEVYRHLPNSTDFTEFRKAGMQGYNFAFIGDIRNYHTPDDNFENADRRCLQHHGENAWRLIKQLNRTYPDAMFVDPISKGRAVYFDFFNLFVVRWPSAWSLPLSLLAIVVVLIGSSRLVTTEPSSERLLPNWLACVLPLLAIVDLAILGKLVEIGFRFDGVFDSGVLDHPVPVQAAFWAWAITMLLAAAAVLAERISWDSVWLGTLWVWSTLAVASSIWVNGASYLFVVPLLFTAVVVSLSNNIKPAIRPVFVAMAFAISVGLIWMPMERLFYDALGFRMMVPLIGRIALVIATLLPLLLLASRRALWRMTIAFVVGSGVLTVWSVIGN